MVNWKPYLESLCKKYAHWWKAYTVTDVIGHQRLLEVESAPLLDFMVRTIQPAKDEPSQKQEKHEILSVLAGLRKYAPDHVLLVGQPGSGKSTALTRLLLEEAEKCRGAEEQRSRGAEERQKIPVLVQLRYYRTSVLDLIRSFLKENDLLLDIAEIERLLFEKQFLLLVDGLNELPSEDARRDLMALRRENAATLMIFTTRDLGVGGDLAIAKKLEMQPLTESQMRDFVKRYLPEQGEQMLRQLGDRLREFGQTPLLLMMLCSVFRETGNVPPNLGLVFRQFTQMYNDKLKQDVAVTDESRRWWQLLLEHLALKMTHGRELTELQVAISRKEAEEILTEFLRKEEFDKPRDRAFCWLQDLLNHHLIQLGVEDKIEFRHQLIQEYYTAESLLKQLPQLSDNSLKREYLNYLKWTESLALMLELVEQEDQAVRLVRLALEVDLTLGAKLAGAGKPKFQGKTVGLITHLEVPQVLKIEFLGITCSDCASTFLREILQDKDSRLRHEAARALEKISSELAITTLIDAVNDENSFVSEASAYALAKIGNETAVNALIQALNNTNPNIHLNAAYALAEIGNESAESTFIQALYHEDFNVRLDSAYALAKIGSETAVNALNQALNDEEDFVQAAAAYALAQIGSEDAKAVLINALNHKAPFVRERAAEALEAIGNPSAIDALVDGFYLEAYFNRNKGAYKFAYKLAELGDDTAIAELVQALQDVEFFNYDGIIDALVDIGNPRLLPILCNLLLTTEEKSIQRAILAIQERCKFYNYTLIAGATGYALKDNRAISVMHILHLSDLHFGTPNNAQNWYNQLAEDLCQELKCPRLDTLILSGDIANKSTPEEYNAAKQFLDNLCEEFQLQPQQIVIVPGNHDLNWGLAEQAYRLERRRSYQGELQPGCYIDKDDILEVRDEELYKQRFTHFSEFYQSIKGELYPLEYDQQGILHHFPEQNLLILALNSAWQLDHHYKSRASINANALNKALTDIRRNSAYKDCLKLAVWHHPLNSAFEDRITDHGFMEQLAKADFRFALHGHIHKAETSLYSYDLSAGGRKLDIICAGTFGAPIREWVPGYPLQYNLLKLEPNKLTVYTRRREELNGAWKPDARWLQGAGQNPLPYYEIS